jgi:hypothetical protein
LVHLTTIRFHCAFEFVHCPNELNTVPFTGDGKVNALAKLMTEIKVATQSIVTCRFSLLSMIKEQGLTPINTRFGVLNFSCLWCVGGFLVMTG